MKVMNYEVIIDGIEISNAVIALMSSLLFFFVLRIINKVNLVPGNPFKEL